MEPTPEGRPGEGDAPGEPGLAAGSGVLEERYGRAWRPGPRLRTAAVGTALALGALWAAWVAGTLGSPPLRWEDVGFRVVSASAVEVEFRVYFRRPEAERTDAVCVVQAHNQAHTVIGRREVTVRAEGGQVDVRLTVPTAEPAVTGVVEDCVEVAR